MERWISSRIRIVWQKSFWTRRVALDDTDIPGFAFVFFAKNSHIWQTIVHENPHFPVRHPTNFLIPISCNKMLEQIRHQPCFIGVSEKWAHPQESHFASPEFWHCSNVFSLNPAYPRPSDHEIDGRIPPKSLRSRSRRNKMYDPWFYHLFSVFKGRMQCRSTYETLQEIFKCDNGSFWWPDQVDLLTR